MLVVFILVACSEYNLVQGTISTSVPQNLNGDGRPESEIPPNSAAPDVSTEEAPTPSDTGVVTDGSSGVPPGDPGACNGFLINEGFGNYEETESLAIYSLVSDSEITVKQGEEVKFLFAVTASHCGDIILTGLTIVQSVIDYTPADWVTAVEHSGESSSISSLSGSAQFDPSNGYNITADDSDFSIFYPWEHDSFGGHTVSEMDEVNISSSTTEVLEFSFTATEYTEPGVVFELRLISPEWIDVATGAEVSDEYYYLSEVGNDGVQLQVTVTD